MNIHQGRVFGDVRVVDRETKRKRSLRMKEKIFILVILLFLTCTGGCLPHEHPVFPPQKEGEGFHREDLLLAQSHIPKNVMLSLEGEYLNNPEAAEQLKSGLVRLGFNLREEQKVEAVLIGYCSVKLVVPVILFPYQTKEYYVKVQLISSPKENVIWMGSFYGSSIGKSTEQVLRLLEKDIKLFNTKLDGLK
jgi:hypothetical protein